MDIPQRQIRLRVDIPVMIVTVLETFEAAIADLNEHGALVTGCGLEPGARFQIDYFGQIIFAQCRWSEIDRMGAHFIFPLLEGPLYERLLISRPNALSFEAMADTGMPYTPGMRGIRAFGRRPN